MHKVQIPEAYEGREEVKPPPLREDDEAVREEARPAPTPRPPRATCSTGVVSGEDVDTRHADIRHAYPGYPPVKAWHPTPSTTRQLVSL